MTVNFKKAGLSLFYNSPCLYMGVTLHIVTEISPLWD